MQIGAAADGKKAKATGSSAVTRGGVKSLSRTTTQSSMNRGGVLPDAAQQHGADRQDRGDNGITGDDFPESVHGMPLEWRVVDDH